MNGHGLIYASPNTFTLKQRLALTLFPPTIALLLKVLCRSCTIEYRGREHWTEAIERGDHVILAFWHEAMALGAYFTRNTGAHTLTSYSYDGEMAARVIGQFGLRAVRGSSSRGGLQALSQLKKATKVAQILGLTLDGPRGPHRIAKPGAAMVAATTQLSIYPMACTAEPAWRLNSWDRLPIPKPFGKITFAFGPPIAPPEKLSTELVEQTRLEVEEKLNALHSEIEGPPPAG